MTNTSSIHPVVVGIDGSKAALDAALWAVDEVGRDVPLRLLHVTGVRRPAFGSAEALAPEIQYGETSLRAASSQVADSDKTVKVEAELLWGPVGDGLITESMSASMLCVGSVGIGWAAQRVLGSTAATVAEKAHCPVAVVRSTSDVESSNSSQWIVVSVDARFDNDQVVTHALDEARLRNAPGLAVGTWHSELGGLPYELLEGRVGRWRERYLDLHIRAVSTGGSLPQFLAGYRNDVLLAVVGVDDADQLPLIVGPHERPLLPPRRVLGDGSALMPVQDEFQVTETLVDGAEATLRTLHPEDYDAVISLAVCLNAEERYQRFFTVHPTYIGEWALSLTTPARGIVALGAFESGELIGVANYAELNRPGECEIAVVVAHEQHERGVGTALLKALGHIATDAGKHRFVADVLFENYAMRRVLRNAGWPMIQHRDGSVLSVEIDIDSIESAAL